MKKKTSLKKFFNKHTPTLKRLGYTCLTVVATTVLTLVVTDTYHSLKGNRNIQNISAQGPDDCSYTVCSDFKKNIDKWVGNDKLVVGQEEKGLRVKAPLGGGLEGWLMYYNKPITPDFNANFKFTPHFKSANTVFQYGDVYEIIFGDGDPNKIGFKSGGKYLYPVDTSGSSFRLDYPIQIGASVVVNIDSSKNLDNNDIIVTGDIIYYTTFGEKITQLIPKYVVPGSMHTSLFVGNIHVGLIDPSHNGDVEATFESITAQNKILNY